MSNVTKKLLTRGIYDIVYEHECDCGDCVLFAPSVKIYKGGYTVKLFHTRRLLKLNRTTLEAVGLAFDWILADEAKDKRAAQEAEIASEQAQALAEFAADLNGEVPA